MLFGRRESGVPGEVEPRPEGEFGRWLGRTREILIMPRAFSRLVEFLVVITIISIVATALLPTFLRVRRSAYITTCLETLNEIGHAMEMYHIDYGAYPRSPMWYGRLRAHLGPVEPPADPLKCLADRTDAPVSYHYLDESLLPPDQRALPLSEIPMVVDETFHGDKATVLWYDYHKTVEKKAAWMLLRSEVLDIRRDTEHPDWFRFIPEAPPAPPAGEEE